MICRITKDIWVIREVNKMKIKMKKKQKRNNILHLIRISQRIISSSTMNICKNRFLISKYLPMSEEEMNIMVIMIIIIKKIININNTNRWMENNIMEKMIFKN